MCFEWIELTVIFMTPLSMATILLINGPSFTDSTVMYVTLRSHTSLDSISNFWKVDLVSYKLYIISYSVCSICPFEGFFLSQFWVFLIPHTVLLSSLPLDFATGNLELKIKCQTKFLKPTYSITERGCRSFAISAKLLEMFIALGESPKWNNQIIKSKTYV